MGKVKAKDAFLMGFVIMVAIGVGLFLIVSVLQVLGVWPSGWEF
ncbi:hypothetical protein ES703_16765 [subsurface metagenome]